MTVERFGNAFQTIPGAGGGARGFFGAFDQTSGQAVQFAPGDFDALGDGAFAIRQCGGNLTHAIDRIIRHRLQAKGAFFEFLAGFEQAISGAGAQIVEIGGVLLEGYAHAVNPIRRQLGRIGQTSGLAVQRIGHQGNQTGRAIGSRAHFARTLHQYGSRVIDVGHRGRGHARHAFALPFQGARGFFQATGGAVGTFHQCVQTLTHGIAQFAQMILGARGGVFHLNGAFREVFGSGSHQLAGACRNENHVFGALLQIITDATQAFDGMRCNAIEQTCTVLHDIAQIGDRTDRAIGHILEVQQMTTERFGDLSGALAGGVDAVQPVLHGAHHR